MKNRKISIEESYKIVCDNLPELVDKLGKAKKDDFIKYAQLEILTISKNIGEIPCNFIEVICPQIVEKSFEVFLVRYSSSKDDNTLENVRSNAKIKIHNDYKKNIYPFIDFIASKESLTTEEITELKHSVFLCGLSVIQKKKRESVLKLKNESVFINEALFYQFIVKKIFLNCVRKSLEESLRKSKCLDDFTSKFELKNEKIKALIYKMTTEYWGSNISEIEEHIKDYIRDAQLEIIEKIRRNEFCLSSELTTYISSIVINKFREERRRADKNVSIDYQKLDKIEEYLSESGPEGNVIIYFLLDIKFLDRLDQKQRDIFEMDLQGYSDEEIAQKYNTSANNISQIRRRIREKALNFLQENSHKIDN